jgi:asparagine synthase (glutamine-hydrolysing)
MCGIAGILSPGPLQFNLPAVISAMADTLRHRGPDDEGYVLMSDNSVCIAGGNDTQAASWNRGLPYSPVKRINEVHGEHYLALAHRRLSVIDLSEAAHQPMCNDDGSVWIICNGEIYNYIELRTELEAKGYNFKTQSDIEVLLKAYECWDLNCLDRINGMWAFVIYDHKQKIIIGARDRFGVKPLYYYDSPEYFAFASEQKALLQIPGIKTGLNRDAAYEHLLLGQVELREEGFYKNVHELLPAHYFIADTETKEVTVRKYYHLSYNHAHGRFDQKQYNTLVEGVRERIYKAIEIRLRSDVPVGFCLSGGIDSSSIVCVSDHLKQQGNISQLSNQLHTFTAVNASSCCDESGWAKKVVDKTGCSWIRAECRAEDILPSLETLIWHQDVPLYHTSTFAQNRVMKAAKENGITILLDGQGGDELFAGYQTFYTSMLLDHLLHFRLQGFLREFSSLGNSATSAGIFARSLAKISMDKCLPGALKNIIAARYRPELNYFTSTARRSHAGLLNLAGEFSSKPLNELLDRYFTGYYLKNLLRWEDRCSMQYSVESRTPFSDDINLIEYVFSIPGAYKIHKGWSKALFRDAMKGILPEEIRTRRDKLGFTTPQSDWLQHIHPLMKARIADLCTTDDTQLIDHQRLLKNWELIFSTPRLRKAQDLAWRYLNFLLWKKMFIK